MQSTKLKLIFNRQTARMHGLTVPDVLNFCDPPAFDAKNIDARPRRHAKRQSQA